MSLINLTQDPEVVNSILNHPDIVNITPDNGLVSKEDIADTMDSFLYFKVEKDKELAGLFAFNEIDDKSLEIHINMLKPYRGLFAKMVAEEVISNIFRKTQYNKLVAKIPTKYPNVLKFASLMGFKMEYMLEEEYIKDGTAYDVVQLILKKE